MNPETSLTAFEDWTLRVRPPLKAGNRILLMLHGWQGDENSMWVFARNFPSDAWLLAPRALHVAREGGYTWRTPVAPGWPSVDTLRPAVEALARLLDDWSRAEHLDSPVVDVIGFSQGAALTFAFGLLHPARVRKMGILAGFAPEGAEQVLAPGLLEEKTVFVAHGSRDETVPIEQARRSVRLLEGAGAQVIFSESNVAHKLGLDSLKALETYLA